MARKKITMVLNSEERYWITSDTHYGHKNICRGVTEWRTPDGSIPIDRTRDFKTIDHMNDTIVTNINKVVKPNDTLIHVGDWSFGGFENVRKFWDRINCENIFLVMGNHDHHVKNNKDGCQIYFLGVYDRLELIINKELVIIDHYPLASWERMGRGSIHLHGHSHLPNHKKFGNGRKMDIGIDGHPEFRPYDLFNECLKPLRRREILSDMDDDHHLNEYN